MQEVKVVYEFKIPLVAIQVFSQIMRQMVKDHKEQIVKGIIIVDITDDNKTVTTTVRDDQTLMEDFRRGIGSWRGARDRTYLRVAGMKAKLFIDGKEEKF